MNVALIQVIGHEEERHINDVFDYIVGDHDGVREAIREHVLELVDDENFRLRMMLHLSTTWSIHSSTTCTRILYWRMQ